MAKPARKKLPIPMDDADQAILAKTAARGGLASSRPETPKPAPAATPEPARQTTKTVPEAPADGPEALFKRNDLRPQISFDSKLADALAEAFTALDPKTRRYVKPASMLKEFLDENDEALAKLFRKSAT